MYTNISKYSTWKWLNNIFHYTILNKTYHNKMENPIIDFIDYWFYLQKSYQIYSILLFVVPDIIRFIWSFSAITFRIVFPHNQWDAPHRNLNITWKFSSISKRDPHINFFSQYKGLLTHSQEKLRPSLRKNLILLIIQSGLCCCGSVMSNTYISL